MDIQIQDLRNAGISDIFIEIYINNLKLVYEGGDISQLKEFIKNSQLTNSQKALLAEYTKQQYCKNKNISEEQYENGVGKAVVIGGAVGGASSVGIGYGLSAIGFTTSGVAKASIAAGIQSTIGSVQAGSAFAIAQSIGAKGLFFSPVTALVLTGIGAGVGVCIYLGKKYIKNSKQKGQQINNQSKPELESSKNSLEQSLNEQITPQI